MGQQQEMSGTHTIKQQSTFGAKMANCFKFLGQKPYPHPHTRACTQGTNPIQYSFTQETTHIIPTLHRGLDPPTAYMYHPRLTESYITIQNLL